MTWDEAFSEIGKVLNSLDSPDRAEFYTSGRASNEAAYIYQLFVRLYGTNNFPDCSNMCHEASGVALEQAIGIGKGTVVLEDFEKADAIFVIGQNPGTNHPRMLGDLRRAAQRGARIAVFNPVREKGLERFADPQDKLEMLTGGSTPIASEYYPGPPRRRHGRRAWDGESRLCRRRCRASRRAGPRSWTADSWTQHTSGFEFYRAARRCDELGADRRSVRPVARRARRARADLHRIRTRRSARGRWASRSIAIPSRPSAKSRISCSCAATSAGPAPAFARCAATPTFRATARSASTRSRRATFLDALEKEFGVPMPREHGHNVIAAIGAMLDGSAQAFIGLGGNFARATPDTSLIAKALMSAEADCQHRDEAQSLASASGRSQLSCCRASGAPKSIAMPTASRRS